MQIYDQIIVFSHTDLDGFGANVICQFLKTGPQNNNIIVTNVNNNINIKKKIEDVLFRPEYAKYCNKLLVINDLGVNEKLMNDLIELAECYMRKPTDKRFGRGVRYNLHVVICDHHQESSHLELKPIHTNLIDTFVNTGSNCDPNDRECGTKLFSKYVHNHLCDINSINPVQYRILNEFVEHVNNHDCWIWKDRDPYAERLNAYFTATSNSTFVFTVASIIATAKENQTFESALNSCSNAKFVIQERERDVKNTCIKMLNSCRISKFYEYNIATVICDRYTSAVGNYICEQRPDIDFCMILNPMENYISFRGIKDDINLARFSNRIFGGNGHKLAAAAKVKKEAMLEMIREHM